MSLMAIIRNKLINSSLVLLKSSSEKQKEKFVNVIFFSKYNLVLNKLEVQNSIYIQKMVWFVDFDSYLLIILFKFILKED